MIDTHCLNGLLYRLEGMKRHEDRIVRLVEEEHYK
jgi:hypothetical protein